jgi:predicted DNA-binding transcriptional regulator AlpA
MIATALAQLTLAELAQVGAGQIPAALGALAEAQAALTARLVSPAPGPARPRPEPQDGLLTAQEVAERLGLTRKQVYRRAGWWPFTRRLGPKTLRFDLAGMELYLGRPVSS